MKKSVIYIMLMSLVFLCIAYFIRTGNFILGSNRAYFRTIDDYPNSEWICDSIGAEIKVYNENFPKIRIEKPSIMKVKINEHEKEYVLLYDFATKIMMFDMDNVNGAGEILLSNEDMVFSGKARYHKNLSGEVTKMTIYNIKKDEIFNNKYKKLVFKRK